MGLQLLVKLYKCSRRQRVLRRLSELESRWQHVLALTVPPLHFSALSLLCASLLVITFLLSLFFFFLLFFSSCNEVRDHHSGDDTVDNGGRSPTSHQQDIV